MVESNCSKMQPQRTPSPEPQPPQNCSVDKTSNSKVQSSQPVDVVDSCTSSSSRPGNYHECNLSSISENSTVKSDCTLRRSNKIHSQSPPENDLNSSEIDLPIPVPRSRRSSQIPSETESSDIENITPVKKSPSNNSNISAHDKLLDEITSFRFKPTNDMNSSGKEIVDDDGSFTMSRTYVNRRRSEIEARIRCSEVLPDYRKYSEGTLTFSKMPMSFVFPDDGRYLIYDSKYPDKCHTLEHEDRKSVRGFTSRQHDRRPSEPGVDNLFLKELNTLLTKKLDV